jgi:hypothetical protein
MHYGFRISPVSRLLASIILLAACLLSTTDSTVGLAVSGAAVIVCLIIHRPRVAVLVKTALAGLIIYAPLMILTPLAHWIKSIGTLLIGVTTYTAMGPMAFHVGVRALMMPNLIRLLILQILHQAGELRRETLRIMRSIAVRGGTSGVRVGARLAMSLPQVWLPRLLFKADRVAAGMDLRGYTTAPHNLPAGPWSVPDGLVVVASVIVLGVAVFLQVGAWG